ncbi:fibronectin type 3 and ankyrin repeat domains protein 1 [Hydra vulgaris]|uniref:fibronectin type 3 and ankyrin repeat domains protein 1 n=1 Tax=Hydra vulgaris TaxID=6087 RepID=UPI001F5F5AE8|nr:fibronectin type 3 and ankyrin repeat domains protein 1 [Hydra vulgaris]
MINSTEYLLQNLSNNESTETENKIAELIPITLLFQQNSKKSSWSTLRNILKERVFMKKNSQNFVTCSAKDYISEASFVTQPSIPRSVSKTPNLSRRYTAESFEDAIFLPILQNDYNALVKNLKTYSSNINYMRAPGLTPLHQACAVGNLKMVKTLIVHGADTTLRTWSNLTPLLIANLFGHFDVALFLINQGANTRDIQDGVTFDSKLASTVTYKFEKKTRRGSFSSGSNL